MNEHTYINVLNIQKDSQILNASIIVKVLNCMIDIIQLIDIICIDINFETLNLRT